MILLSVLSIEKLYAIYDNQKGNLYVLLLNSDSPIVKYMQCVCRFSIFYISNTVYRPISNNIYF